MRTHKTCSYMINDLRLDGPRRNSLITGVAGTLTLKEGDVVGKIKVTVSAEVVRAVSVSVKGRE